MGYAIIKALIAFLLTTLANTQDLQKTWSSVAFTISGETTPVLLSSTAPHLTPLGANQLHDAGSLLRSRFLEIGNTSLLATVSVIEGLSPTRIDNTQINVLATDEEWVSVGAQAFMQGLYPPLDQIYVDGENVLVNGTLEEWPLNGYQYPNIQTFSDADYQRIWVAGSQGCPYYDIASGEYVESSNFHTIRSSSNAFYQALIPNLFEGIISSPEVSYYNALELYDYASYQYTHNVTVDTSISSQDMLQLGYYASEMSMALNGNTSLSLNTDDFIGVISGRTLANKIATLLMSNVNHSGSQDKLSLLFGDIGPMTAFFALSGLTSTNPIFLGIPQPGSTMVFELFSVNSTGSSISSTDYPNIEDLWVRFLFRNGTDGDAPLRSYPLFERGLSQSDMIWGDFLEGMESFMVSGVEDWCQVCGSVSVWCEAFDDNFGGWSGGNIPTAASLKSTALKPAIAGLIGALVTLALAFLVMLLTGLLFGFRVERKASGGLVGGAGGFKGKERKEEDRDVVIEAGAKGGEFVGAERVGSWELKDNVGDDAAKLNMVAGPAAPAYKKEDDEWEVDPFGKAIEIREHV